MNENASSGDTAARRASSSSTARSPALACARPSSRTCASAILRSGAPVMRVPLVAAGAAAADAAPLALDAPFAAGEPLPAALDALDAPLPAALGEPFAPRAPSAVAPESVSVEDGSIA